MSEGRHRRAGEVCAVCGERGTTEINGLGACGRHTERVMAQAMGAVRYVVGELRKIANQQRGSESMIVLTRHTAQTTKNPARVGAAVEVEFTEAEQECADWFEELLDTGLGVRDAACAALLRMRAEDRTNEFAVWLSDDTLYLDDNKAVQVR